MATCILPAKTNFARFFSVPGQRAFSSVCIRDKALSVAVTDQQPNGLSAIYTFFEPDGSAKLGRTEHTAADRGLPITGPALSLSWLLGSGLREDGLQD